MNPASSPEGNKFTGVYCQIFGHNYVVTKQITRHIKEYKCSICQREVTTTPNGKLEPLTPKLKEINSDLQQLFEKRRRRVRRQKVA